MMGERRRAPKGGPLADRFELRAKLGEGGMGVVYRAWDETLGKEVALKRVRHEVDAARARQLKSEFRARSALQHRNLVQLYELVVEGGDCFLTMELVDGTDLASWARGTESHQELPVTAQTQIEGVNARVSPESDSNVGTGSGTVRSPGKGGSTPRSEKGPIDTAGVVRLRAALTELCSGLAVLHDAGIVHHDISPANVRVAPGGRVVLLDFGLAARSTTEAQSGRIVIAGTPRYMAPEQIRADATTPAADIYAVGGILHELITGRGPFSGSFRAMQVAKAAGERPLPIPAGSVDDELAALAVAMLDPDPLARPDARAVLTVLAGGTAPVAPTFGLPTALPFVGRQDDLTALTDAVQRVRAEQRPMAMIVEGPSGIGKTTLLKHALSRIGPALVLTSRCHPQETIPFKALDAAMETFAEYAGELSDLGTFPPALAHAAVRVFPALEAVWVLGRQPLADASLHDAELRAQAFEALRSLFARVARLQPIVLWIDDVQWDDEDSSTLLESLLRGRGAPPILLLVSLRTSEGETSDSAIVRRLIEPRSVLPVERRTLEPLGAGDVGAIAAGFLAVGDARIARVVRASEGNPFLASELARYLSTRPPSAIEQDDALRVSDLVAARLRDLEPAERALLVVTSLAARPLTTHCAIAAAQLTSDARTSVLALRDALLVRHGTSGAGETIAPYHDKIAEATQHLLSAAERTSVHRAIAESLERLAADDADALAIHWEGAGEPGRAASFAWRAAENAAVALAFGRAADLYEKAIRLGYDGVERAWLFERTGAALANDGHAPAAARRYLDASRALGDDVNDDRVRTLKRRAAEQYVKSGYMRHGWAVMRSVLDAAKIPQPASPTAATLGALVRRVKFLAKRIDIDSIGNRQIPDKDRAWLEILWTASTSMSMINVTLSDAFRTQHLSRVLEVGDRSSIARALAYEVALEAHVGGPLFDWHAARLISHARRLVEQTDDPYDRAWLALGVANQAFCAGRFRDAIAACTDSARILREECSGVAWELTTVAAFLLTSLAMKGDLHTLRETAERFVVEAEGHGDLFGIAEGYSGECILGWWSVGSGDDALARATEAVARQGADADAWPEKTYRRGELTELMATVHLRLLAGDPWPAWTMMLAHWEGLKSAMIPSLQFYRSWLRHGRARVALAAIEVGGRGADDAWTRPRLLDDVRRMHRDLKKDTRPFGPPWAALIEGALAFADGHRDRAVAALERAVAGFDKAEMALYREATRFRLAALTGSQGRRDEAEAWLRAQGVPDPGTLVFALVPGFGPL